MMKHFTLFLVVTLLTLTTTLKGASVENTPNSFLNDSDAIAIKVDEKAKKKAQKERAKAKKERAKERVKLQKAKEKEKARAKKVRIRDKEQAKKVKAKEIEQRRRR